MYRQLIQLNDKKKKKSQKMGRPKQTVSQRKCTSGQQVHEKVLNITN